jgi:hypothetical protein
MHQRVGDLLSQRLFYTALFIILLVALFMISAGLSQGPFYRAVHRGLDAINDCPGLSIKFPMTLSDLSRSAVEFKSISSHGIIDGCIAALDGWLCCIRVPSAKKVRKVKAYFSGHYQCYGLNVQPLVMPAVVLHLYQSYVLEAHLIVRHFMPQEFIT